MISLDTTDLVVIDDDEDLRTLTRLAFQIQGWDVVTASDGRAGLQVLRDLVESGISPAILLDIQMPELDGWEVLRRIRSDPLLAELPVLLCSVRAGEHDQMLGSTLGADGFVAKPFDLDHLVSDVERVSALTSEQRAQRRVDAVGLS